MNIKGLPASGGYGMKHSPNLFRDPTDHIQINTNETMTRIGFLLWELSVRSSHKANVSQKP
jgi:hypothetical protein